MVSADCVYVIFYVKNLLIFNEKYIIVDTWVLIGNFLLNSVSYVLNITNKRFASPFLSRNTQVQGIE